MKGTIDQQNIPDSRGTSVVPIRATQSPATNYFIACGFAPGLSLPVSASVGRINAIELVFLFLLSACALHKKAPTAIMATSANSCSYYSEHLLTEVFLLSPLPENFSLQ